MLQRPGSKKKKSKKKQDRSGMLRLFAFCFLLGPMALAIAGWVMRNDLWLQFMMENHFISVQRKLTRTIGEGDTAKEQAAKEEVKRELDRLVMALRREKNPLPLDEVIPLGNEYDEALESDGKMTPEEARGILDKLKVLLDKAKADR